MRDKRLFIASIIFFALAVGFILAVFSPLKRVFSPFITALALSYLFLPWVKYADKLRIKPIVAVLIIYALIALAGVFVLTFAFPRVYNALISVWEILREFLERLNLSGYINGIFSNGEKGVYTTIVSAARWFFDFFVGIVAAFYILSDVKNVKNAFKELIPTNLIPSFRILIDDVKLSFDSFFKGQILIAVILFLMDGVFLYAVRVPYAWGLAFIAAAFDIVPYAGAFLAMGIICIVTLISSPSKIFLVLTGLLVIQQIENNIITPKISSSTLALHPAVTVLCLYLGSFGGFWGILLAIPLTCVFKKICERMIQSLV